MSTYPVFTVMPEDCQEAVGVLLGKQASLPKEESKNIYFEVPVPGRVLGFLKEKGITMYPGMFWAGGSLVRVLNNLEVPTSSDIDLWVQDPVTLRRVICSLYAADPGVDFKYHDCLIVVDQSTLNHPIQLIHVEMSATHVVEDFDGLHLKAFLRCNWEGDFELVFSRHYCRAWMTKTTTIAITNTNKDNFARRVEKAQAMGLSVSGAHPENVCTKPKLMGKSPYKAIRIGCLLDGTIMAARSLEEMSRAYGACPSGVTFVNAKLPRDSVGPVPTASMSFKDTKEQTPKVVKSQAAVKTVEVTKPLKLETFCEGCGCRPKYCECEDEG